MKFALKVVKNRFLFFNVKAKPVYLGKPYLTLYFNYTEIKPQKIVIFVNINSSYNTHCNIKWLFITFMFKKNSKVNDNNSKKRKVFFLFFSILRSKY